MYYGETRTVIDEKSRITIPARMRETMRARKHSDWYMGCVFDRCLFLIPHEEWQRVTAYFDPFEPLDPSTLEFRRLLFGSVTEVALDGQGRVPLAVHQREHAGLQPKGEAIVVGVGSHIEIWNPEAWRTFTEDRDARLKRMAWNMRAGSAAPEGAVAAVGDGTDNTSNVRSEGERAPT